LDLVKARIPGAKIGFNVDENLQKRMGIIFRLPLDDCCARQERGWKPEYV
jgi:hypothetical protein